MKQSFAYTNETIQQQSVSEKLPTNDNTELGSAVNASSRLINSLHAYVVHISDETMHGRLCRTMIEVIKRDKENSRGHRTAANGDSTLLEGFEFNRHNSLQQVCTFYPGAQLNRKDGILTIKIPPFRVRTITANRPAFSHFRIVTAAVSLMYDSPAFECSLQQTAFFPYQENPVEKQELVHQLVKHHHYPVLLAMGIEPANEPQPTAPGACHEQYCLNIRKVWMP